MVKHISNGIFQTLAIYIKSQRIYIHKNGHRSHQRHDLATGKKVKSGTNTASPTPISHAIRASCKASVPLAQAMQCFTPTNSESRSSNCVTCGPLIKCVPNRTSCIDESMCSLCRKYCVFRSRNSTLPATLPSKSSFHHSTLPQPMQTPPRSPVVCCPSEPPLPVIANPRRVARASSFFPRTSHSAQHTVLFSA